MNKPAPLVAGSDIDPEIRLFQQRMAESYARYPDLGQVSPVEARAVCEAVRAPWVAGGPAMAETRELRVGPMDVRIRIHYPRDAVATAPLVYIHGGGWTLFSLDTHDRVMREYAARTGAPVVGVDYSLSPEARFPRALDEIASVIAWLRAEGVAHGLDGDRLAIGGDSVGGNMSLASALKLRDAGLPQPSGLVLNYGVFESVQSVAPDSSYQRYGTPEYMLTAAEMTGFWDSYIGQPSDREDPLARLIKADLTGIAPVFMAIAECDVLLDENLAMAARLKEAGVTVEPRVYVGATHSFLEAVAIARVSNLALDDASEWLKPRLKG